MWRIILNPVISSRGTKAKRVGELKEIAQKADSIILATDPDREGEAIAWHISKILETGDKQPKKEIGSQVSEHKTLFQRIVFHEITRNCH